MLCVKTETRPNPMRVTCLNQQSLARITQGVILNLSSWTRHLAHIIFHLHYNGKGGTVPVPTPNGPGHPLQLTGKAPLAQTQMIVKFMLFQTHPLSLRTVIGGRGEELTITFS